LKLSLSFAVSLALGTLLSLACCAAPEESSDEIPPSAQQLLADVRARLPRDPLRITGNLIVRRRHGVIVGEFGFDSELRLGEPDAAIRYRILDQLGKELEALTIVHGADAGRSLQYSVAGEERPLDDLSKGILTTDLTWMDLTLSFLWWQGGTVLREESIKGRPCYVVELPVPDRLVEARRSGYAKVLLWIDVELRMLLQAEGQNDKGEPVRRLWIKSLKKIDDRWMIKDMEVQQFPPLQRTKLRVRDVESLGPS